MKELAIVIGALVLYKLLTQETAPVFSAIGSMTARPSVLPVLSSLSMPVGSAQAPVATIAAPSALPLIAPSGARPPFTYQDPLGYNAGSGSGWVARTGGDFVNWVESIQTGGYPHITGVVNVGSKTE